MELIFLRGMRFYSCCVKQPSVTGCYRERDVTEPVFKVRPIGVPWGKGQGCKVASQAESCCSWLRSRGKLERHAAWHCLVEMSDSRKRNHALTENSVSVLNGV